MQIDLSKGELLILAAAVKIALPDIQKFSSNTSLTIAALELWHKLKEAIKIAE